MLGFAISPTAHNSRLDELDILPAKPADILDLY
jgi:hypothetical protein